MASLWERATSAGGSLVIGGLLIWLMAWSIDFFQHLGGQTGCDPSQHCGDALVRVNFPLAGFPLIVMGGIILFGGDRLLKRGNTPLFAAGMLIALDGIAHAFAFDDHLFEPLWATLFALTAPVQIVLGIALPYLDRGLDRWWWLGTLALLVGYIVTRVVTVPELAFPEPVESLDIFSKFTEVMVLVILAPQAWGSAPVGAQESRVEDEAEGQAESRAESHADPHAARGAGLPAGD